MAGQSDAIDPQRASSHGPLTKTCLPSRAIRAAGIVVKRTIPVNLAMLGVNRRQRVWPVATTRGQSLWRGGWEDRLRARIGVEA